MNKNEIGISSATCHCEWGFRGRRCPCFMAGKGCSANCSCACQDCNNPFNGVVGVEGFTDCARAHIMKYKLLSEKELQQMYALACDCKTLVSLCNLVEESVCPVCQTRSFYSFCLKEVVQASKIKHCPHCHRCTPQVDAHCADCGG